MTTKKKQVRATRTPKVMRADNPTASKATESRGRLFEHELVTTAAMLCGTAGALSQLAMHDLTHPRRGKWRSRFITRIAQTVTVLEEARWLITDGCVSLPEPPK